MQAKNLDLNHKLTDTSIRGACPNPRLFFPVHTVGSIKYGFTNPGDVDKVIIIDTKSKNLTPRQQLIAWVCCPFTAYIDGDGELFVYSLEYLETFFNFTNTEWDSMFYLAIRNYDAEVSPDMPCNFHLLEHKNQLKKYLKLVFKEGYWGTTKDLTTTEQFCEKHIYNIAYLIFCLEENKVTISPEHFKICQKIHDLQMPISYLKELRKIVESY